MKERSAFARVLDIAGDLILDTVQSEALRDNALGDPSSRALPVYVPAGYDAQGSRRYPVLYVLHGYGGDAASTLAVRLWEPNVVQWIDRLIAQKKMPPAILVIVDGNTRLGGSQYVDSIHNGQYATYLARDVVSYVDARYRSVAREAGRAVLGRSSGGFGAIHAAMRHPGVFCAFASHSGDAYFRYSLVPSFATAQRVLESYGRDPAAFVADFEQKQKRSQAEFETMTMLAQAAAYSPRDAKAFGFDLPFDLATGELDVEVFRRWLCFDPVEDVSLRSKELARLRLRYLDCGRRDEYGLDIGARALARVLRTLGLEVEYQEFDDGHRNIGYRYAMSLPALAAVMEHE
jgi:enterochelin esterase family protein